MIKHVKKNPSTTPILQTVPFVHYSFDKLHDYLIKIILGIPGSSGFLQNMFYAAGENLQFSPISPGFAILFDPTIFNFYY